MQDYRLTTQEITELVRKYQSEVRKLEYQILKTKETIEDLQNRMGTSKITHPLDTTDHLEKLQKRPGRPASTQNRTEPAQETARPAAKTAAASKRIPKKRTGYRLSEWDKFIINNLEDAQQVLINSQLMELAKEKVERDNLKLDDIQLRGKLNRSIHKLANKRGELIKVDYPGKGFAYGLSEWADENGEVESRYQVEL